MSKVDVHDDGPAHVPFNWIRKFLIESIYRRLSKFALRHARVSRGYLPHLPLVISFPETAKWNGPADEYVAPPISTKANVLSFFFYLLRIIRVGITAKI